MKKFPKNHYIYFDNEAGKTLFFLKKGKVKISKFSNDGKEIILSILGPGDLFGELAIMGAEKREEVAKVMEEATICSIHVNDLEEVMKRNPSFNLRITKLIGMRLKKIQNRLELFVFKNTHQRIANFLVELAEEHGRQVGVDEMEVRLPLTHSDIAKLTATSRQTVTSMFSELQKEGTIIYDRRRILIKDLKKLESRC